MHDARLGNETDCGVMPFGEPLANLFEDSKNGVSFMKSTLDMCAVPNGPRTAACS